MAEYLLEDKMCDRPATLKEAIVGTVTIFVAVAAFGFLADRIFGSEEKAQEARKLGYDV